MAIQPHDKVLEVAVETGLTFLEILKQFDCSGVVSGIDLSPHGISPEMNADVDRIDSR